MVRGFDEYEMIFKRKSFHLFRGAEAMPEGELAALAAFCQELTPLDSGIRTAFEVVPESATTCKRGAQYCLLLYSEEKPGWLQNAGYLGEQVDLYLAARDIGALWFGIGKPPQGTAPQKDGLTFVIMLAFAKMPAGAFRRDMYKAKRKALGEIWPGGAAVLQSEAGGAVATARGLGSAGGPGGLGSTNGAAAGPDALSSAVAGALEVARFAPSACNTQPWQVALCGGELQVYRYKRPGKRGIMPAARVGFYNRIDVGIFLYILELCLRHGGVEFSRTLHIADDGGGDGELTLNAGYGVPQG